jgi:hypothetical protein
MRVLASTDLAIVGPKAAETVPKLGRSSSSLCDYTCGPTPEGTSSFCFFWESLGDHLSLYIYFAILPPFIFVISMFDILAHRLFIGSEQCLCASWLCILCFSTSSFFLFLLHTSCVFFLCIHACPPLCYIIPRHPFGGLYIWRSLYIWRNISIWRALSVLRAPSSFLFFPSSKASIPLTLRYQLRQ